MPQIVITVTDPTVVARIVEALRAMHPAETQGLTDLQAVKAAIKALVKQDVKNYEAVKTAGTTNDLNAQINQIVTLRQQKWDAQFAQTDTDMEAGIT